MKPQELNIEDWQRWLDKFKAANPTKQPLLAAIHIENTAIRIENTMFTPARYYGGMEYKGNHYTYFELVDERQPRNPDGTPYVAWLMVRMDFLRWVTAELKKEGKGDGAR